MYCKDSPEVLHYKIWQACQSMSEYDSRAFGIGYQLHVTEKLLCHTCLLVQKTPRAGLDGRPMTRATERQKPRGKAGQTRNLTGLQRQSTVLFAIHGPGMKARVFCLTLTIVQNSHSLLK